MYKRQDYGDGANPVILKSEFILSLCEQLIGGNSLGAKQKSIIDRCTASVYRYYQQGNYMGTPPTLQDFREESVSYTHLDVYKRQDLSRLGRDHLKVGHFTEIYFPMKNVRYIAVNDGVDTANKKMCIRDRLTANRK